MIGAMRWIGMVFLLAGCATTAPKPAPDAWLLRPEWTRTSISGDATLKGRSGQTYPLKRSHLANLRAVLLALKEQSRIDPQLVLIASDTPNAFATARDGAPMVGLTLSMLDRIGEDPDALATTVGHELAHLELKHGEIRKQRAKTAQGISHTIGAILSVAGVPLGGTIADFGVGMVTTAYSRDEEREADILGLRWAVAAGYSACGSARTMRMLQRWDRATPLPFLASHPGDAERIERADQAAREAGGAGC